MELRSAFFRLCAFLAALTSVEAYAVPVTIPMNTANVVATLEEDPTHFVLTVQGLEITDDFSQIVAPFGTYWRISFVLAVRESLGENNPSDMASVTGTAYHVAGPHGEPQALPPVTFSFNLAQRKDRGILNGVEFESSAVQSVQHGVHKDNYAANALVLYVTQGRLAEIRAWEVTLSATHAVPEPSSYALLLAGIGVVGVASRRRPGTSEALR